MAVSLSNILSIATSGLATAQTGVSATSDNITNVNTVGYVRKIVNQAETVLSGSGAGVHVAGVIDAANTFLQNASLSATSASGAASAVSTFMDQAEQLFGDPSSSTNFFSGLDSVYSAFSAASDTPSSSLARSQAVGSVTTFLNSATDLSDSLAGLSAQANQQASTDVGQINSMLGQISDLNHQIAQYNVSGGDASGLEDQQAQLLNKLSGLMQVQVQPNATGGMTLRSVDGVYLAGDQGAATLNYSQVGGGNLLTATAPQGQPMQITAGSGEVAGLMQLTGVDIPNVSNQLGEFVSQAVSQINAAHNASTAVPAPATLTGSSTGMALQTAIAGFSGNTTVAVVNSSGVMQQRVDIDFGAGTMTVNGGGSVAFTGANFLTQLNTALGGAGTASYVNGALSISAAGGGNGVSIADDPTTPSSNGGQGFSQFFGLNNLVTSSAYANVTTNLTLGSPNTIATGGTLQLALTDANGSALRQVNLTVPGSAATVGDLVNGLNASVGAYGSFALDAQGHIEFTPNKAYAGTTVSTISDNTVNTAGGPNMSQLFGLSITTQAARAASFSVRSDIAADPTRLALAQLDLTQSVGGSPALAIGDGRGAAAISTSGASATTFSAAGGQQALRISVSDYGAQLSGKVGVAASSADAQAQSATAMLNHATAQLSAATGVNLDTELVNLTTYQQSYNASARLVQAAKDMYAALLQMMQ